MFSCYQKRCKVTNYFPISNTNPQKSSIFRLFLTFINKSCVYFRILALMYPAYFAISPLVTNISPSS